MKKSICLLMILCLFQGPACFAADPAPMSPEQFYLNQASAEKFGELRKEAQGSFQGILLYPDDIRNSVLVLSQYPDLIALIDNKKVLNEAEFDKLLKEQPAEVLAAIEDLKAYPEVIDIMDRNIVVTALLGEMVRDKKEETLAVVKRLSDSVKAGNTEVVNAWTQKLQQDPKAVQELQSASEAYAKANNLPSPNKPMTAEQAAQSPNPYGYYVNEKNTVIIQQMPSQDVTSYMLANQMMYTMLFACMANNYYAYRNDYYWHAYDEHHEDWQNAVNNNTNAMNNLNNNIDEIQAGRDQAQQGRQEKKDAWKENHPQAGTRPGDLPAKGDRVNNGLPGSGLSGQRDMISSAGGARDFSGARNNVSFQAPSRNQQISQASQFHSGSWSGGGGSRGGGGGGGSRGGGGGGSRGGGGGSRGGGGGGRGGGGRR